MILLKKSENMRSVMLVKNAINSHLSAIEAAFGTPVMDNAGNPLAEGFQWLSQPCADGEDASYEVCADFYETPDEVCFSFYLHYVINEEGVREKEPFDIRKKSFESDLKRTMNSWGLNTEQATFISRKFDEMKSIFFPILAEIEVNKP